MGSGIKLMPEQLTKPPQPELDRAQVLVSPLTVQMNTGYTDWPLDFSFSFTNLSSPTFTLVVQLFLIYS